MFIRNDYPILEFDDNRDAKKSILRLGLTRNSNVTRWLSLFFRKWLIN